MNQKIMDCLTNPIKCKLLIEIDLRGKATAKQLGELYNDIPQATLYRYLNKMLSDGVLKVVEEKKIRGVIERAYSMTIRLDEVSNKMLEENSGEAYMQMFIQYMMGLMNEFKEYTSKDNIDIINDISGFTVAPFYSTDEELITSLEKIGKILEGLRSNKPTAERRMRSICTIITPPKK